MIVKSEKFLKYRKAGAAMGVENIVTLKEALESPAFEEKTSCLTFVAGTNNRGDIITADLKEIPHLVVAGATGTGKSSFVHGLIVSILKKSTPKEVKFVLCDTKILEFGCYSVAPHLLIPPATNKDWISNVLTWSEKELQRRLNIFVSEGCRSFQSYNNRVSKQHGEELPYIVLVVDDAAVVADSPNARDALRVIAQNGRTAGLHLIMVTQSPNNRNISDVIKNSVPGRAMFHVLTNAEEKLLFDSSPKESTLEIGEMYFRASSSQVRQRIHCCRVSDDIILSAVREVEATYPESNDRNKILSEIDLLKNASMANTNFIDEESERDEMLPAAVDVILETGQAFVSILQRRLKVGYAQAARIMDEMEEKGIVGPFQGAKPRAILITKEQWQERNGLKTTEIQAVNSNNRETNTEIKVADSNGEELSGESQIAGIEKSNEIQIDKTIEEEQKKGILCALNSSKNFILKIVKIFSFLILGVLVAVKNDPEEDTPMSKKSSLIFGIGILGIIASILCRSVSLFWLGVGVCIVVCVSAIRWGILSILFLYTAKTLSINAENITDGKNALQAMRVISIMIALYFACKFFLRVYKNLFEKKKVISIEKIDNMTGVEFEKLTAKLLKQLGYSNVTVTKSSGDQGIDVLANKDGVKYAIQCKNYSRKLDNTPVQEAFAGKTFYHCDVGVVITNNFFTDGAKQLANSTGVILWDRNELKRMLEKAYK